MIKIAIPNKGQLFEPTVELLTSCGYRLTKTPKSLTSLDPENNIEFYFLRPVDIPLYVASGILDAGVTGKDFAAEKGVEPTLLVDLHYGRSRLCAAVPKDSPHTTLDDVAGLQIATSFPEITRSYFRGKDLRIVTLEGAVEISVQLGIADAIVDVVETGGTLDQAGLRVVGEPLFRSNAALFARPGHETFEEVATLQRRIEGRMVALEYVMVEYDCPVSLLSRASELTPGIESPTVSPLQNEGWVAVKAMLKKRESHRTVDELAKLGCKGILLMQIEMARI